MCCIGFSLRLFLPALAGLLSLNSFVKELMAQFLQIAPLKQLYLAKHVSYQGLLS
jgi:hypothetical protein